MAGGRSGRAPLWVVGSAVLGFGGWRLYLVAREHPRWTALVVVLVVAGALTWAMRATHQLRARRRAASHVESTDTLTGPQFEHWCAELLRHQGFREVRVCGRANDRGVDVTGVDPDGLFTVVQCKRQSAAVGSPVMRQFVGAAVLAGAERALFVTNSRFTSEAAAVAEEREIELVDRDTLADWLATSHRDPSRESGS